MSEDNKKPESSTNLFGLPIISSSPDDKMQNDVSFNDANESNLKNMIYKLENEIRSGNITPYTCELYRQVSQLATFDKIILDSTIIKPADLTMLQEKVKEFEIKQAQTDNSKDLETPKVEQNHANETKKIEANSDNKAIKLTEMNNDEINKLREDYFKNRNDYVKSNQEAYQEQLIYKGDDKSQIT